MQTYKTRDGDVLDLIAYRHYGEQSPSVLRAILDANPGLAGRGPILPAGVRINLPELVRPVHPAKVVALWD